MSHSTELLTGKPILVQTCHPDYTGSEITALWADGLAVLERADEPLFYVIDLAAVPPPASGVPGVDSLELRSPDAAFCHPNIREVLPVAHDMTTLIEGLGLSTVLIGERMKQYFHSLDDALAYCYEQINA